MGGSLEFAANVSGICVSAMQNYTGIPYALDKLDIVAITGTGFAMENWGLIIAGYSMVYSDPKTAPIGTQWGVANVLCHEIAHQWFGDLVTADIWGDLFLHESFAEFFSNYLFMEFGTPGQQQLASGSMAQEIERGLGDAESLLHPLVYTTDDFDYVYAAGASVLASVEYVFGKDAFRDALRSYLRAHEFGNARYRDLVAAFQLSGYEYRWTMLDDRCGFFYTRMRTALFDRITDGNDESMLYRLIEDELYFVGPTSAIQIVVERLKRAGQDGRIGSNLFDTAMTVLNRRHGLDKVHADRLEESVRALLTPIYSAIGWNRVDEDDWDKRALQESLLLSSVSYDVDNALTKAQEYAQKMVSDCGDSKNFPACITLNVEILPAALCGALKSNNASAVELVDAYEAYLTQDYVLKYIGNAEIVVNARDCAQRKAQNLTKIGSRVLANPRKGKLGKAETPTEALVSAIPADTWRKALEEVIIGL